jgi:hypothetical protein
MKVYDSVTVILKQVLLIMSVFKRVVQESTTSNLTIAVRHTAVVPGRPTNVLLNGSNVSGKMKFTD